MNNKTNMDNFTQIRKHRGGSKKLKENEVSIGKTCVFLNNKIAECLNEYVEVFLNEKDNEVLFVQSSDKYLGFKIGKRHYKNHWKEQFLFQCREISKKIECGRYFGEFTKSGFLLKDIKFIDAIGGLGE